MFRGDQRSTADRITLRSGGETQTPRDALVRDIQPETIWKLRLRGFER